VRVHPDLVVLDLDLPRREGIDTTRQIVTAAPGVGVLVMTRFADDRVVFEALCAGARGHLDKGALHGEIVAAVSAVANGDAVLGPGVARLLVDFFGGRVPAGAAEPEPLTGREHEVVNLVAAGWSTADIAKVLVLTEPVVRGHITAAVGKLQVAHRSEPGGLWDAADGEVTPVPVDRPRRAAPRRRGTRRGRRR
jgi:DNA-binding NarL/FixJ family response regulator